MTADPSTTIFTIVVLILSVIMHEVAHGYAAYVLGDPTAKLQGRLTLNPLAHLDLFGSILIPAILVITNAGILFGWAKPVPYNPYNLKNQRWGEAIVGFAGVATNLFLAVVFAVIARIAFAQGALVFATLASTITFVNLSLGIFNLIPFPPLDGYTVLRGILPIRFSLGFLEVEQRIFGNNMAFRFVILFVFVYFLSTPFYHFVEWVFRLLIG